MTIQQQAEQYILDHVPYYRQTNAVLFGEHEEYVRTTLQILRDYAGQLIAGGATEWVEPDAETLRYITDNRPY